MQPIQLTGEQKSTHLLRAVLAGVSAVALLASQALVVLAAPPVVTFSPSGGASEVDLSTPISITFDQPVRAADDSELTDETVDDAVTLRTNDASGEQIAFDASISEDGQTITVTPDEELEPDQTYYVAVAGDELENDADEAVEQTSATFTTAADDTDGDDTTAPTATTMPAAGATDVGTDESLTINFDEQIELTDGRELTNENVAELITLTNEDDEDVAVDVSISADGQQITVTPVENLEEGMTYSLSLDAGLQDAAGNAVSTMTVDFQTAEADDGTDDDTTAPSPTFTPANAATDVAAGDMISVSFDEAIRAADGSELTDETIDDAVELRVNDAQGEAVDFDATLSDDDQTITIDPAEDLTAGETYYVAIQADMLEDEAGNVVAQANATFTVREADDGDGDDTQAPTPGFTPADAATDVAADADITITWDEAIRAADGSELTDETIDDVVELRVNDAQGEAVAFDATISSDKMTITIAPESNLTAGETYYVAVNADALEDEAGNPAIAASMTFTVAEEDDGTDGDDTTAPTVTIDPADAATDVAVDDVITVTFDEPVTMPDGSDLTNENVDALVALHQQDSLGEEIDFDATVNDDDTVITVDPAGELDADTEYYFAFGPIVRDEAGNLIAVESVTFETEAASTPGGNGNGNGNGTPPDGTDATVTLEPGWNVFSTPRILESITLENNGEGVTFYSLESGSFDAVTADADAVSPLEGFLVNNENDEAVDVFLTYDDTVAINEALFQKELAGGWSMLGVTSSENSFATIGNDATALLDLTGAEAGADTTDHAVADSFTSYAGEEVTDFDGQLTEAYAVFVSDESVFFGDSQPVSSDATDDNQDNNDDDADTQNDDADTQNDDADTQNDTEDTANTSEQ